MEYEIQINNDPDNIYAILKNFDIEKKIGKGQFSEVYRAQCKVNESVVALKKVQVLTTYLTSLKLSKLIYMIMVFPLCEKTLFK